MTIGPIQIELTGFANPCRNIGPSFKWRRSSRVSPRTHPGEARLYARVRTEGIVSVGDPVSIL
jgi:MOSC domain-containing protein YiiM